MKITKADYEILKNAISKQGKIENLQATHD